MSRIVPFSRLAAGPHAGLLDEALRGLVGGASLPAAGCVDVELRPLDALLAWRRQPHLVADRPLVIGELQARVIDTVELPKHIDEVGLTAQQMAGRDPGSGLQGPPAEVLLVEHCLSSDQLLVELWQRQACGQHRMLDVVEAVVAGPDASSLGVPGLGAGIGGVDADVDDLGDLQTKLAHHLEAFPVPVRIGDNIDRDLDAERSRALQGLEVLAKADTLAVKLEAFFVDGLDAEEHVTHPERLPVLEEIHIAQEHIAARLEVILFLDAAPRDRLPDGVAVTRLDKGDVIDDEDSGLLDLREVFDGSLRAQLAVAPTIKGSGAAEGAIPGGSRG